MQHRRYASWVARKILWGSLALAPATAVADFALHWGDVPLFALAALALIPLAWLIGEATEHAAEYTGPGIGGFLNATFGNAPELIIALLAVHEGLTEVVRGSLTGSVVGNLLLVLGFSLVAGGTGKLERWSSLISFGAIGIAIALFLVPAIPSWSGDPDRHRIAQLSVPVSIVLLLVYVAGTVYALRRHRVSHVSGDDEIEGWSFRTSLLVLGGATAMTALVAEILVGSIERFSERAGLSDFFVAAVIVAIVGNAAEHGGAVVVAYRGQGQARGRDRALLRRAGRRVPHSRRGAALVADRPARARLPQGRVDRSRCVTRDRRCLLRPALEPPAAASSSPPTWVSRPRSFSPATGTRGPRARGDRASIARRRCPRP